MVQNRVSPIEQRCDSAAFEVPDQLLIFRVIQREVGIPGQRRNRDDGAGQRCGSDLSLVHVKLSGVDSVVSFERSLRTVLRLDFQTAA